MNERRRQRSANRSIICLDQFEGSHKAFPQMVTHRVAFLQAAMLSNYYYQYKFDRDYSTKLIDSYKAEMSIRRK